MSDAIAVSGRLSGEGVAYALLAFAIAVEVGATTLLRLSNGFTRPVPGVLASVGYAVSLGCLALVLRELPLSFTYAVWAGLGTGLVAIIGLLFLGDEFTARVGLGIALILAGVVLVNLAGGKGA